MTTLIINLLLIALFCTLVIDSGFFEEIDGMINRKWKFRHLPKPFHCSLCATTWLSLLFITVTGNLSIFNAVLCLAAAYSTKIISPLAKTIENFLLGVVNRVNQLIEWVFFK